jgi:hypothetical protein
MVCSGAQAELRDPPLPISDLVVIGVGVFFFLYVVLGVAVNKRRGKEGKELMPNIDFWNDCCGSVQHGYRVSCVAVCGRCIPNNEMGKRMRSNLEYEDL